MVKRILLLLIFASTSNVFSNTLEKETNDKNKTSIEILKKANEACKKLSSIKYQVNIKYPDSEINAIVTQKKSNVKDVGIGESKVLVEGTNISTRETKPFMFSYDGSNFKFKEGNKNILAIENPGAREVGRTLGMNYYLVVTLQFGKKGGMGDNLISSKSELLGIEKVYNRDAYRVKVYRTSKNPSTGEETESSFDWYFDTENYLPVKFQSGNGYMKKEIKIISIDQITNAVFDINPNKKDAEKKITGKEADIEGLPRPGSSFPSFELSDFKGKSFSNTIFASSKITLVDFWGTWCGPCIRVMPGLQELYEKYGDKGLNVIGISVLDKPGKPQKFVDKKGYKYQFLLEGDELAKKLKLAVYPTVFLIDSKGNIIHAEKGAREEGKKYFESIIKKFISQ